MTSTTTALTRINEIFDHYAVSFKDVGERKLFVQFLLSQGTAICEGTVNDALAQNKPDHERFPILAQAHVELSQYDEDYEDYEDKSVISVDEFMSFVLAESFEGPPQSKFPVICDNKPVVSKNGKSVKYGCKIITRTEAFQAKALMEKFDIFNLDITGEKPVDFETVEDLCSAFDKWEKHNKAKKTPAKKRTTRRRTK